MLAILSTEADVHTATPSLSNAAATWAGWAVTAVTAKFYRSQSDTAKSSVVPHHPRMLSKPGSLGKCNEQTFIPYFRTFHYFSGLCSFVFRATIK